jgi:hypothetical protein
MHWRVTRGDMLVTCHGDMTNDPSQSRAGTA